MAGISSPAAFKRVNSVTFFSGHTEGQGCPFSLAANVFFAKRPELCTGNAHTASSCE